MGGMSQWEKKNIMNDKEWKFLRDIYNIFNVKKESVLTLYSLNIFLFA